MMIPQVRMHRHSALIATATVLLGLMLAGCGGGSGKKNVVAQVNLAPSTVSAVAGEVVQLSVTAVDANSAAVTTVFTFNSSDPRIATVSPKGEICGGVWDTTFVTCNGLNAAGQPINGTALVTATAAGITSSPVTVNVHPNVTSVTVTNDIPTGACFSNDQTHQFTSHAFNGANDITSAVGTFTWTSTNSSVVSVDANGLATAHAPGLAQIVAAAGTSSSPGINFKTCMPVRLTVHVPGDAPGQPTLSATMNVNDTKTLEVDMTDENGNVVNNVPGVQLISRNPTVATIGSGTLTALGPGGTGIVGACTPPGCGAGLNQPVYSNLFGVIVNGTSAAPTVYVASKDLAQVSTIIPIDTSKNPPVAGTQITLPGHPNSFVFAANGNRAYIGTDAGLVSFDPGTNTVTTVAPEAVGTVLAVSPDGSQAVISNAPNDKNPLNHRLRIFNSAGGSLQTFILHNAVAAAFTPDAFKAYIGASDGNVYVFSPAITLQTLSPGGSIASVAVLPSGSLAFLANSGSLDALNVCNNSAVPGPLATAHQLVNSLPNTDTIVAVNSTGLDLESVTVGQPASGFCPSPVSFSNQPVDFGVGAFTARQLIVAGNGPHVAVLPVGINKVLSLVPGNAPTVVTLAAGATEALSGGLTQDGNLLWVGVQGDHTLHRVNLITGADEFQMQPNANSAQSTPDLVAVRPQ